MAKTKASAKQAEFDESQTPRRRRTAAKAKAKTKGRAKAKALVTPKAKSQSRRTKKTESVEIATNNGTEREVSLESGGEGLLPAPEPTPKAMSKRKSKKRAVSDNVDVAAEKPKAKAAKRMKRPAAQVDEKNDTATGAGKSSKEYNPFEHPPPEGQESLGQYFHVVPAAPSDDADAHAADAEKDKDQENTEPKRTDGQASSVSSSLSSSSSSASEPEAMLTFHTLDDDFDISSPPDSVPQDVEATYIATDGATDNVRSFDSMFRFAERHVDRVERHFGDAGMQNLANNLNCTVLSLYSGLGGAELSLSMLHNQVVAKGWDAAKPTFAVACDIDPVCRSVLASHQDHPKHIVADLLDFLTDDTRKKLQKLVADARKEADEQAKVEKSESKKKQVQEKKQGKKFKKSQSTGNSKAKKTNDNDTTQEDGDGGGETPMDSAGKALLNKMLDLLKDKSAFKESIPCLVIGKDGSLTETYFPLKMLMECGNLLLFAGSVCKDWSSMNAARSQLLGKFVEPFGTMIGLAKILRPKIFVHECTRMFDRTTLEENLPDHNLHSMILDPTMFGMPVKRGRSYCALILKSFTLEAPVDFMRKFYTPCDLGSEIFFVADEAEVESMRAYMAAARLKRLRTPFEELLPPVSQVHLAQLLELPYVQKAMQEGKEITANLDQNPLLFDHHGRHVPVVLASTSHMWGALRARPMTWKELLLCQGVPVTEEAARSAGFKSGLPIPFRNVQPSAGRRLAGNSFNQACSAAFICFIMSQMKPVST